MGPAKRTAAAMAWMLATIGAAAVALGQGGAAGPSATQPTTAPAPLQADRPTVPAPKAGSVSGTISPAERLAEFRLVSRATGQSYRPAKWNDRTGAFTFADLPGDSRYDVVVRTKTGRRLEGIDLDFVDARLLRLAAARRKQLGLPDPPGHRFSQADAKALMDVAAKQTGFMDLRRPLAIAGHGRRATMLVETMRTRDFHAGKGQVVWRTELWYFQWFHGGWQRLNDQEVVLERFRGSPADWRKIDVAYLPAWSVYVDTAGRSVELELTVPPQTSPATGRPAGTDPQLPARPVVVGIDVTATTQPTASAPARAPVDDAQED